MLKKINTPCFARFLLHFPVREYSLLASLLLSLFPAKLQAVVTTYPQPDGIPASRIYTVSIDQDTQSYPSFVYTAGWQVAGVGDFDQNGCSDIVLRDGNQNVEVIYFQASGATLSMDYPHQYLGYASTSYYNTQRPSITGKFDSNWNLIGVGDFQGNGSPACSGSILAPEISPSGVSTTSSRSTVSKFLKVFGECFCSSPGNVRISGAGRL